MEDPCHKGDETCCVCEAKDQRQSVVCGGTKLGSHPRRVDADDARVPCPEVVLKAYQRRYPGSHKPVSRAADGRSGSIAELDHRRLTGTGSENGTAARHPGDGESISTNVGKLAALSLAEESILIAPTDLDDVKIQRPEVQLKTYQRRYSGSYKDIRKATDGRSGSRVELGHQSEKLTGTGSKNSTVMGQPDDRDSIAANIRNLTALSISEETVSIAPTGKSCHAQAKPVKINNNNNAASSRKGGSNITQTTRHFPEAVRNSWTKPPTGFKQVWRPKGQTELPKESPQLVSNASKAKDKRQNSRHSSKSSTSKKHKNKRRSKQNGGFHTIVLNGNQPVGHACCLCGNDLAYSPTSRLEEPIFKSCNFPDVTILLCGHVFCNFPNVAILLCGHVFHMQCMEHNMSEEQLKDPQCFLCDNPSFSSDSTCIVANIHT